MSEKKTENNPENKAITYENLFLVGIGASAGGLEVLQHLLNNYGPQENMAFVVVQHLSPDYKSQMAELLKKHTTMDVFQVQNGIEIKANSVYVMPEKKNISVKDGKLILTEKDPLLSINFPIDIFFHSLGLEKKEQAIGLILSGTGTDGSRGIKTIKENGGIIIVQEPRSAKFTGMPVSAIATQLADFVLSIKEIGVELENIAQNRSTRTVDIDDTTLTSLESLNLIIKLIHKSTGIDFSLYKRNTIYRRLERRMHLCKTEDLKSYYNYLNENPSEVFLLQQDLLIGVTQFFRDTEAFDFLAEEIIPKIFEQKQENESIRIWTPGCSTGEEAYSILMLFEEYKEKHNRNNPVKIFATDIDTYALEIAGNGRYTINIAVDVNKPRLNKFFIHEDQFYKVIPELRNQIVFARHNIFSDPPFNRVDMIVCRNILIYLGQVLQQKVFSLFQFAINPEGFLFLGPSESLGEYNDQWLNLNKKWKFFRFASKEKRRIMEVFPSTFPETSSPISIRPPITQPTVAATHTTDYVNVFKEILADQFSPMCAFINLQMDTMYISGGINKYLNLPEREMRLNIMNMLPQELVIPLSTAIQKMNKSFEPIRYNSIFIRPKGQPGQMVDLTVEKITHKRLLQPTLMISLLPREEESKVNEKIPGSEQVYTIDDMAKERINFLEQQLVDTRENLQLSIEEKETSNEELQASTEELQASNEELMAANEELQSTNEELQSVNEELHALNSELQSKILELTEMSNDMENFLNSTEIGTIFLDDQLRVRKFTPAIVDHIRLIREDVGRPIRHFNTVLGNDNLANMASGVLTDQKKLEKKFNSKDDRPYLLRIQPYKNKGRERGGIVIAIIPLESENMYD